MSENKSAHQLLQPPGWPKPRGYANGVKATGSIVMTGGLIGWDENEKLADGFVAQARQAFKNIVAVLAEGGAKPEHLTRMTWYVCDIDEYLNSRKELGAAYLEIFGHSFPAMALVAVTRLVEPKARLEIEATAVVP